MDTRVHRGRAERRWRLTACDWPGDIRELENAIDRAASETIQLVVAAGLASHLPSRRTGRSTWSMRGSDSRERGTLGPWRRRFRLRRLVDRVGLADFTLDTDV